MSIKVNWLIAHKPVNLFIRTAKAFQEAIKSATKGKYEIVIHEKESEEHFEAETGKLPVTALSCNDYQMSQTEVYKIGKMHDGVKDFLALDLPFLFESHDHCSKAMEGDLGDELNFKLSHHLNVQGLAYTYSGGYRNFGSNTKISSLADLQNSNKIKVGGNPVCQDYIKELGVETSKQVIQSNTEWLEMSDLEAESVENTYTRFPEAKYWLNTNHNMFITDIMVSNDFWSTLSDEDQEIFRKTAIEVARLERKWSEEDHENYELEAKKHGKTITKISKEDKIKMKEKAIPIYEKWEKIFSDSLISKVKSYAA